MEVLFDVCLKIDEPVADRPIADRHIGNERATAGPFPRPAVTLKERGRHVQEFRRPLCRQETWRLGRANIEVGNTPIETQFLWDAAQGGLKVISGYELFFGQGFDAWNIFMETPVDQTALREAINSTSEQNSQ